MSIILPGATLGVLGGGQLGRMFVQAAQRMGYYTAVLDQDPISPAGAVAHYHIQGTTDDEAALAQLMQRCAAITTEFENVSAAAMVTLGAQRVVSPSAKCVAIAQNRIEEKAMLKQVAQASGVAQAGPVSFVAVEKMVDITSSPDDCFPGLLKTATLGYDGKGQVKVSTRSQASIAFNLVCSNIGRDSSLCGRANSCARPSAMIRSESFAAKPLAAGSSRADRPTSPEITAKIFLIRWLSSRLNISFCSAASLPS